MLGAIKVMVKLKVASSSHALHISLDPSNNAIAKLCTKPNPPFPHDRPAN